MINNFIKVYSRIKISILITVLCLALTGCQSNFFTRYISVRTDSHKQNTNQIWKEFSVRNQIPVELINKAVCAYNKNDAFKKDTIAIIDYSKPSTEKRLYVIDLKNKKILHHTLVAHGKNSGENMAFNFSNIHDSYQSSLGVYKTAEIYLGKNGISLRMDGLDLGINDNVRDRNIVIHGADYVSQDFIDQYGRLGRSHGCPALPVEISEKIIRTIANGTCLYIHGYISSDTNELASN